MTPAAIDLDLLTSTVPSDNGQLGSARRSGCTVRRCGGDGGDGGDDRRAVIDDDLWVPSRHFVDMAATDAETRRDSDNVRL